MLSLSCNRMATLNPDFLAIHAFLIIIYRWKFQLAGSPSSPCPNPNATFPNDYSNKQCAGLTQYPPANDAADCMNSCCADSSCEVWQWCDGGSCTPQNTCWTGSLSGGCTAQPGWVSRGRAPSASPSPIPPGPIPPCNDPRCEKSTDDSSWRVLNLPHDFVVEGNFTSTADKVSTRVLTTIKSYFIT